MESWPSSQVQCIEQSSDKKVSLAASIENIFTNILDWFALDEKNCLFMEVFDKISLYIQYDFIPREYRNVDGYLSPLLLIS